MANAIIKKTMEENFIKILLYFPIVAPLTTSAGRFDFIHRHTEKKFLHNVSSCHCEVRKRKRS